MIFFLYTSAIWPILKKHLIAALYRQRTNCLQLNKPFPLVGGFGADRADAGINNQASGRQTRDRKEAADILFALQASLKGTIRAKTQTQISVHCPGTGTGYRPWASA